MFKKSFLEYKYIDMQKDMVFPTDLSSILQRIERIDPRRYASTRNFLNGAVSFLSPYISRGVISTQMIFHHLLKKGFQLPEMEKFVQELCWRDYFQQVQIHFPELHTKDLRHEQGEVAHYAIPRNLVDASTGINTIDEGILHLYQTGYMHNHLRMYTAMLACNVGKSHWSAPAKWMYYHLLDADVASNFCSWQWVSGAFSAKKYFANQENINRYSGTQQQETYIDVSYDDFPLKSTPEQLKVTTEPDFETELPKSYELKLDLSLPVRIYTIYNLDPFWRSEERANKILILEPSHFEKFPVCTRTIEWVLALSGNIPEVQMFCGEFSELKQLTGDAELVFKEHPLFNHFTGTCDERLWLAPEVKSYCPSFFNYWKKVEKVLKKNYAD